MSNHAIARRYASALYAEASSREVVERVDEDIDLLHQTIADSRDLRLLLASPVVNVAKKVAIIRRLFQEHVSELVLDFLVLVASKRREAFLRQIVDAYRRIRLDERGIVQAHARVAVPMDADETEAVRQSLIRIVDKEILLEVTEDPELVGGILVRIGDTVYDGSLQRRLAHLHEQLVGGSFHNN